MIDPAASRPLTIRDRQHQLEADFIPGLGMVVSSLRDSGEQLLGQRAGLLAYVEHGSTFGIPLLYPWANRLSGWDYAVRGQHVELDRGNRLVRRDPGTGLPIHGILAASPHWLLTDADLDTLEAQLDFAAVPEYLRLFPFPHQLTYRATIADRTLRISLTVTPSGDVPVPICFGFHPYLTLPETARDEWQVQLPAATGEANGPLAGRDFDDPFNDLAKDPAPIFTVSDNHRRLAVRFDDGYSVAQVFSPASSDFIAFEPMTAAVDALRNGERMRFAQPGSSVTATFSIVVQDR